MFEFIKALLFIVREYRHFDNMVEFTPLAPSFALVKLTDKEEYLEMFKDYLYYLLEDTLSINSKKIYWERM